MPPTKAQRHRAITRLIAGSALHSQADLQRELAAQGIRTTQATLSRDLAELGVLKGATGYRLGQGDSEAPAETAAGLVRALLAGAEQAGNLVVLHTAPGQASALAVHLDRAALRGVVGTIAGDDCIFVATRTPTSAKDLLRRLSTDPRAARTKTGA